MGNRKNTVTPYLREDQETWSCTCTFHEGSAQVQLQPFLALALDGAERSTALDGAEQSTALDGVERATALILATNPQYHWVYATANLDILEETQIPHSCQKTNLQTIQPVTWTLHYLSYPNLQLTEWLAHFWDFMQHRTLVSYLHFGSHLQGRMTLEDGADGLSWNVGNKLAFCAA